MKITVKRSTTRAKNCNGLGPLIYITLYTIHLIAAMMENKPKVDENIKVV
jgi:hypothetical protein